MDPNGNTPQCFGLLSAASTSGDGSAYHSQLILPLYYSYFYHIYSRDCEDVFIRINSNEYIVWETGSNIIICRLLSIVFFSGEIKSQLQIGS